MRTILACVLPMLLLALPASATCPPAGYDAAALQALKAREFALADAEARETLALALLECLGEPDPALRDGVAYEALSTWMRKRQLAPPTLAVLRERLLPMLVEADPRGFRRPFAALVLSEVARTDRMQPWLDDAGRDELVQAAATYLEGVRDYRGFIDGEGWRHGVAHGADFAMQLALNPAVDGDQLDRLRDALASQVAPSSAPPYIHGEPMRLARPVLFIARRGMHDAAAWQAWLQRVASPTPLPDWNAALGSEAGQARRHNLTGFLSMLYLLAHEQEDGAARDRLLPGLRNALKEMP
jgi:hypothetical protein